MDSEEFTWQAFSGNNGGNSTGDRVAITCLASAGPNRVAVGGTGGKIEIWDVKAMVASRRGRRAANVEAFGVGEAGMRVRGGLLHKLVSAFLVLLELYMHVCMYALFFTETSKRAVTGLR